MSNCSIKIHANEVWALIPARGGSKSIPLKNMVKLKGRPLIDYAIIAAKKSAIISRIFCSTDNQEITNFCNKREIEVQERPSSLAGDNISSLDVIIYFLNAIIDNEGALPDYLVFLEPTSPFVLPDHIQGCIDLLNENPTADSAQTITYLPSNHHAYNQRYLDNGFLYFRFPYERVGRFNKQSKPEFYIHGNLRVMRSKSVLEKKDIFGERSLPFIIQRHYAIDIDGPEDLDVAEGLLKCEKVKLPHLENNYTTNK
jgi:CMP-N-acetylneuraminic acid synthetase